MMKGPLIQTGIFEVNHREAVCFTVALSVHLLLFLWKGGVMDLLTPQGGDIGEALVVVGYQTEVPSYPEPGAPGRPGAKKGVLRKMVKFFTQTAKKTPAKEADDIAMGQAEDKIAADMPLFKTVGDNLTNKDFTAKKEFVSSKDKQESLLASANLAKSPINKVSSMGTEPIAKSNLKEKVYQVARKDMPFQISKPQEIDTLSNINMVPMAVGNKTDRTVKSLDMPAAGGPVALPALKGKELSSSRSSAGGFGGSAGGGRGGGGKGGDELSTSGMGGGGAAPIGGGGIGTGISGSGPGGGGMIPGAQGQGAGGGFGSGGGSGGGSGYGFGTGAGGRGGSTAMLPRRTVAAEPVVSRSEGGSSSGAGFQIMGPLANRPIVKKVLPVYEVDGRVAIRFQVDSQGNVISTLIETGSGYPSYDKKVMAALQQWLFTKLPPERSKEVQEGVIIFTFKGV